MATCTSQQCILAELDEKAPNAPFLALGQTVFWDEPLKIGIARRAKELGFSRKLAAGVHDTDYFSKLSSVAPLNYQALAHNDTITKDLWCAAAEFSALFGSETVIAKQKFQSFGLNLDQLERYSPGILEWATEAWGWQGVVSPYQPTPVAAHLPLKEVFPILRETFEWAIETSIEMQRRLVHQSPTNCHSLLLTSA